ETDKGTGLVGVPDRESDLRVVWEGGYGQRSDIDDHRITNRGVQGVKTISTTEKTGKRVAIREVSDEDELMIINRSGIAIRIEVKELRVMGRATQGVRLIKLNEDDRISSVEKIQKIDSENIEETPTN